MNGELSAEWFDRIYLDGFQGNNVPPVHHLHILHTFSGHLPSIFEERTIKEKVPIAVIAGGLTNECQPLDVRTNRSFKSQFRLL
jgi:hypothetical protein